MTDSVVSDAAAREPALMVRPPTKGEHVANILRRMILVGELPPGERLTQDDLAERLGVSTMPIREALLRLVPEGLVEVTSGRFSVVRSEATDILDAYWVHARIAGELTARSCDTDSSGRLADRLHAVNDDYLDAAATNDRPRMEALNWQFHRHINTAAKAPKLLLVLRTVLRSVPDGFYSLLDGWAEASKRGHGDILDAFDARDPQAAGEAAHDHVVEAGQMLRERFWTEGVWRH
jgi:DNA-binding GntR family transcriptional regulator